MSANNAQKTPFTRSINQFAEQKVASAIQLLGKALPCHVVAVSGSIVTVAFDLINTPYTLPPVTMPMFGPEYIRYPTQIGDKGMTISADTYLGGVSGLGGGTADLTLQSNLSTLVFVPIANSNWSATENPNALVEYGPDGVIIRDTAGKAIVSVDGQGSVTVHGMKSFGWDINGYGTRITYNGGNSFTQDNYTIGATVTVNNLNWTPPGPPAV